MHRVRETLWGVVWIDLSKEHYGIHGTPDPSKIGYTLSHGCIRLTNWDAWELAAMVKPGTSAWLERINESPVHSLSPVTTRRGPH